MKINLLKGNNIDLLKTLENNSIDSIITDPPYGLSFMNKKWDYDVPSVEFWREVYRVLKPGGHILSFGGTRTYHRMVVNIEDAGFEIRDQIMWIYGSGFPKSFNIGKAVDKLEGNKREELEPTGRYKYSFENSLNGDIYKQYGNHIKLTKGSSPYEGWGTGLKPANEPICLARKPLSEKIIVENVLKYSTGGINIDGCRIGSDNIKINGGWNNLSSENIINEGRFPANVIFDEEAANILDEQSKFFYVAKVSKKERNMGLDGFEDVKHSQVNNSKLKLQPNGKMVENTKNNHPTVKPINLLIYLCRLITPKGGTILDPFMGSGSSGIAALLEGFDFVGMEMDDNYFEIAEARINNYEEYRKLIK